MVLLKSYISAHEFNVCSVFAKVFNVCNMFAKAFNVCSMLANVHLNSMFAICKSRGARRGLVERMEKKETYKQGKDKCQNYHLVRNWYEVKEREREREREV